METLPYGDFSLRLQRHAGAKRVPATGTVEVTNRCPWACVHCYNNLSMDDEEVSSRELSCEEHFNILDEITEAGCLWLLLTGGEIFARSDFLRIYTYAKQKGLLITLFTNGMLITPEIADHLVEWRPFSIEITFYGSTRETHDRVTGVPGSYEACMRGIQLLVERGLPLTLKTMVLTLNKHELWDMKRYAEDLGLSFRFDPMLNARLDGGSEPFQYRIAPEELVQLDLADGKRMDEWYEFCDRFHGPPPDPHSLYHCGAGRTTFHIDPFGQMSACLLARGSSYDLRQGSFREGWEFLAEVRAQKRTRETLCGRCDLIAMCGQCPGWAQLETCDQETPVEYLCRIAHLRAEAFGLNKNDKGAGGDAESKRKKSKAALSQASAGASALET